MMTLQHTIPRDSLFYIVQNKIYALSPSLGKDQANISTVERLKLSWEEQPNVGFRSQFCLIQSNNARNFRVMYYI